MRKIEFGVIVLHSGVSKNVPLSLIDGFDEDEALTSGTKTRLSIPRESDNEHVSSLFSLPNLMLRNLQRVKRSFLGNY